MKNEIFLHFVIWDFDDISHDEITRILNIEPIRIYVKGDRVNPKFERLAKTNGWRMGCGLDKYTPFEDQLTAILDIIEPKIDLFRPFCKKYKCEFSCAIYIYFD